LCLYHRIPAAETPDLSGANLWFAEAASLLSVSNVLLHSTSRSFL
jgi:hypothetical protein